MLPRTFSAAFAKGKSTALTLSGETQDLTWARFCLTAASRSRTTARAANISPVPLKKQSIDGMLILNRRGEPSDRAVEPTMTVVLLVVVEEEEETSSWTDVMIT